MSDDAERKLRHIVGTCHDCHWWDIAHGIDREGVILADCQHRHLKRLFGPVPQTTGNFGCIHYAYVPPEVVR